MPSRVNLRSPPPFPRKKDCACCPAPYRMFVSAQCQSHTHSCLSQCQRRT